MLKPHFYFDIFTKKLDSFVFNLEQLGPVWIQVACLQNLQYISNNFAKCFT